MKHIDGVSVHLQDEGGNQIPEYSHDFHDEIDKGYSSCFGTLRIGAIPLRTFEVVVSFDDPWRCFTVDGVWIELRCGSTKSEVQHWFLDASKLERHGAQISTSQVLAQRIRQSSPIQNSMASA